MDDSSASTSADPLTLPSSPLARHFSPRKTRSKAPRSQLPAKPRFTGSPAKSFIMDTGDAGTEQSPWRIKVTVQAEPRDGTGSPGKKGMAMATTVPLKGGSSSPAKRPQRRKKAVEAEESEMEVEIKRPQRKRKGTPMRRVVKRPTPAKGGARPEGEVDMEYDAQDAVVSSPTKKPAKRKGRKSLGTMPTQRGQRLSQARDELDEALQEAVGADGEGDEDMPYSEAMHGDMTAMNEDFTMISVETLQSMKQNTSMLEDSHIGDKSAVNGSYWPSSPPETQKGGAGSAEKRPNAEKVDYPNIEDEARSARDTPAKGFVEAFDAMSWKPTGQVVQEPTPAESSEVVFESAKKQGPRPQQRQASQQSEHAPKGNAVSVDDESEADLGAADPNAGEDRALGGADGDDIWAEEASRSLEDVDESHLSRRSRQQRHEAPQPKPNTAEQLNDLFSGLSSKPPRAKIPRTWRRSSGMDLTYSDSPAHSFAQEDQAPGREQGVEADSEDDAEEGEGDRGSGVITPPSTDSDEEDDDAEMEDAEAKGEAEGEADAASRSVFEPDAAATELQVHGVPDDSESEEEEDAAEVEEEGASPDADDTGLFWQNNLPNVYQRPTRPRLAEQRKAQDLSSLLREDGDSSRVEDGVQKQAAEEHKAPPPAKRFPGSRLLAARREAASSSFTSTSTGSGDQSTTQGGVRAREKVVNSPLRRSLLKSSKIGGAVTAGRAAVVAAQQEAGPESSYLNADDNTGNVSTSFASKASDQRQLLEETVAVSPVKVEKATRGGVHDKRGQADESLWHHAGQEDGADQEEACAGGSSPARSVDYSDESEVQYTDDYISDEDEGFDDDLEPSQPTARSYEEDLNLSSPQKVRVNFGDSSTTTGPSHCSAHLQPKRAYSPLFTSSSSHTTARPPSRDSHTRTFPATAVTQPQSGILTKLTTTFWSVITRPAPTEPVFPAGLRTELRARYGVLGKAHPWTHAHMRTLHRMMNSGVGQPKRKRDSLIPAVGAEEWEELPSVLLTMVGKGSTVKDPMGRQFELTEQMALVVWCFSQLLVDAAFVEGMEKGEIDFVGDSLARVVREGWDEYGGVRRYGGHAVFAGVKGLPREGENIGLEWVVRCLGACVAAQAGWEKGRGGEMW